MVVVDSCICYWLRRRLCAATHFVRRHALGNVMLAKLELWAGVVLAVLAGIGVAILYGYGKGRSHAAAKVKAAQQKLVDAKTVMHEQEVRTHVDTEIAKTPDAPAQKLASADPDTAAGKLRTNGWLRDDPGTKPKG